MFMYLVFIQSPELEGNVEGNIEHFVLQPANKKMHYKCRITRDRKGMDRSRFVSNLFSTLRTRLREEGVYWFYKITIHLCFLFSLKKYKK